jgi:hypothetical protein
LLAHKNFIPGASVYSPVKNNLSLAHYSIRQCNMLSLAHSGYSPAVEYIITGELGNAPTIRITTGMRVVGAPKCAGGSHF